MFIEIIKLQLDKLKMYKNSVYLNLFFLAITIFVEFSVFSIFNEFTNDLLVYILISTSIFQASMTTLIPEFCKTIKKGEISKYYIRPIDMFLYICMEDFGESLKRLIQGITFILLGILISLFFNKVNIYFVLLFLISLILGLIIAVLISEMVYSFAFVIHNYNSLKAILTCISSLFSGALIPFILLPNAFVEIAQITPFAFVIDIPIGFLIGTSSIGDLSLQILWIIILYLIGKCFFLNNTKKIQIYGG
ncbi:MAG: ABC-2 family transporter protein [Bacilli bacterium]|uniref:ABC-2 family transporter protein n=1 Tax=Anaerorhabdus sp. TaxID=1872524 RepID=UPI002FC65F4C